MSLMIVCENGHDEICHTELQCPMCKAKEKIEDLESKLEDLKKVNADLYEENDRLNDDIFNLKDEIKTLS